MSTIIIKNRDLFSWKRHYIILNSLENAHKINRSIYSEKTALSHNDGIQEAQRKGSVAQPWIRSAVSAGNHPYEGWNNNYKDYTPHSAQPTLYFKECWETSLEKDHNV